MKEQPVPTIRKTITLSDAQDAWIKRQIARGAFTNDSEYIRDLVRRDQEGQARLAGLRQAIAEGLESGVSDQSLDTIWAAAEERARAIDA
ncbi:MAG: type II toxin-antitoxin system ParD family antitoxin [Erythrobacter sp.]